MNIRGKRVTPPRRLRETDGVSTVLLVEDDPEIVGCSPTSSRSRASGWCPRRTRAARSTRSATQRSPASLLDVMLPGGSGFDVCRRIREHSDVPLLFLSARGEDEDKLRGLALGADDYIVKSATPAEVVARVKAVLRRSAPAARRGGVYGRFAVDRDAHEVRPTGAPSR